MGPAANYFGRFSCFEPFNIIFGSSQCCIYPLPFPPPARTGVPSPSPCVHAGGLSCCVGLHKLRFFCDNYSKPKTLSADNSKIPTCQYICITSMAYENQSCKRSEIVSLTFLEDTQVNNCANKKVLLRKNTRSVRSAPYPVHDISCLG